MNNLIEYNLGFSLTTPQEVQTVESFYELNKYKYKNENNFLYEGKVALLTEDNNFLVDTNAFLTKDGIIIVEDWELAKEFLNDSNPLTEIVFFKNEEKNGFKVLLDDDIQWMRADTPEVQLPEKFINLEQEDKENYEQFKKDINQKFKIK